MDFLVNSLGSYYQRLTELMKDGLCALPSVSQYNSNPKLLPITNVWRAAAMENYLASSKHLQKRYLANAMFVSLYGLPPVNRKSPKGILRNASHSLGTRIVVCYHLDEDSQSRAEIRR